MGDRPPNSQNRFNFLVASADRRAECLGRIKIGKPAENFTLRPGAMLIRKQRDAGRPSAEPSGEIDCSFVAREELPRHCMLPLTIELNLSPKGPALPPCLAASIWNRCPATGHGHFAVNPGLSSAHWSNPNNSNELTLTTWALEFGQHIALPTHGESSWSFDLHSSPG